MHVFSPIAILGIEFLTYFIKVGSHCMYQKVAVKVARTRDCIFSYFQRSILFHKFLRFLINEPTSPWHMIYHTYSPPFYTIAFANPAPWASLSFAAFTIPSTFYIVISPLIKVRVIVLKYYIQSNMLIVTFYLCPENFYPFYSLILI